MSRASSPIHRRVAVLLGATGGLLQIVGGGWDITWHIDRGRETFWSPPHLVLHAGIVVVLVGVALAMLGRPDVRRSPPLLFVLGATALQLSSAPFDDLWHRLYGLDTTVWSPPHLVLLVGGSASMLALATVALDGRPGRLDRAVATVLLALSLVFAGAVLAEWEFPNIPRGHPSQQRPVWVYPALAAGISAGGLTAASRLLGRGGATAVAALAFLVRFGLIALLLGHRSPPLPPVFLLAPAVAIDAVLVALGRSGDWRRRALVDLAAGLLAAAAYLLVEPLWRSLMPGWPRLGTAVVVYWPLVLLGGAAGGLLGGFAGHLAARIAGLPATPRPFRPHLAPAER